MGRLLVLKQLLGGLKLLFKFSAVGLLLTQLVLQVLKLPLKCSTSSSKRTVRTLLEKSRVKALQLLCGDFWLSSVYRIINAHLKRRSAHTFIAAQDLLQFKLKKKNQNHRCSSLSFQFSYLFAE